MSPPRLPRSPVAMWPHNALLAEVPPYSQFARRTTALWRHIGSGCRRWVGPVLADDHVSGLRVSRPVDVSGTHRDLSWIAALRKLAAVRFLAQKRPRGESLLQRRRYRAPWK